MKNGEEKKDMESTSNAFVHEASTPHSFAPDHRTDSKASIDPVPVSPWPYRAGYVSGLLLSGAVAVLLFEVMLKLFRWER